MDIQRISARKAFDLGLTRYFTGKPCGHGHIAERMISNGSCTECLRLRRKIHRQDAYERVKVWRLTHPGARAKEAAKYRKNHPAQVAANTLRYKEKHKDEIRKRAREGQARMRATNPERERLRILRFKLRDEARKVSAAGGRHRAVTCDLCGVRGNTVWDHSHETGAFRGWLCDRCNRTLGQVHDDVGLLRKMADYVEVHRSEQIKRRAA